MSTQDYRLAGLWAAVKRARSARALCERRRDTYGAHVARQREDAAYTAYLQAKTPRAIGPRGAHNPHVNALGSQRYTRE